VTAQPLTSQAVTSTRRTVTLSSFADVRDAFRHRSLRQALYDEGSVIMADCLLDLHAGQHRDRRRLENRLFGRDTFRYFEQEVLPGTIEAVLTPAAASGRADLVELGYRAVMNLTAMIAGIDRAQGTAEETEALIAFAVKFGEGATMVHSTRPRDLLRAEVLAAMDGFDKRFFRPSLERRRAIVRAVQGGANPATIPRDVLSVLVANVDRLDLSEDVIRREVAFYLQAGGHSTANTLTHTMDDIFGWVAGHPERAGRLKADPSLVQRCAHETLRLHPASPVAHRRAVTACELSNGQKLDAGDLVVLDLTEANRDPAVFGPASGIYDPDREVPPGIMPWGHSFGAGMHACIGMELDGGTVKGDAGSGRLLGTVALMASALLERGIRPDLDETPCGSTGSARAHFERYPVRFGSPESEIR
jgi:cytochrome P450